MRWSSICSRVQLRNYRTSRQTPDARSRCLIAQLASQRTSRYPRLLDVLASVIGSRPIFPHALVDRAHHFVTCQVQFSADLQSIEAQEKWRALLMPPDGQPWQSLLTSLFKGNPVKPRSRFQVLGCGGMIGLSSRNLLTRSGEIPSQQSVVRRAVGFPQSNRNRFQVRVLRQHFGRQPLVLDAIQMPGALRTPSMQHQGPKR